MASNLRVYPCPHDSGVRQRRQGSLRWWWDRAAGQGHYVSQRRLVREDNQDCRIVNPVPIRHVLAVLGRRAEPDGGLHRLVSFSSLHFALHRLVSFSSLHFAGKIIAPFSERLREDTGSSLLDPLRAPHVSLPTTASSGEFCQSFFGGGIVVFMSNKGEIIFVNQRKKIMYTSYLCVTTSVLGTPPTHPSFPRPHTHHLPTLPS